MDHSKRASRGLVAAAAVALVTLTGAHGTSAQHLTPAMAMTMTRSRTADATGCEDRAREAATTLGLLNNGLARARLTGNETDMRAALGALEKGFAEVTARLGACRASATAPAGAGAAQVPAVSADGGMAGMDHSKMNMGAADHAAMGHAAPAGAAGAPTLVRPVSGPAEAALQSFQDALQIGNRYVALDWLAPEVTVTESGVTDASRDAYAKEHMGIDMAFLKTARIGLLDRQVHPAGDSTHIVSTSRVTGRAGEVPVDVTVTEGALLKRTPQGWRIVSLEWTLEPVKAAAR